MNTVYLIRHGATAGNALRLYIGRTDQPISEIGKVQARKLRETAPIVDHVFVSPMLRARETAEIVFPRRDAVVINDLRECDFGDFEGKSFDELTGTPDYQAWVDSYCTAPIPRGENVSKFQTRCVEAFRGAMETVPNGESVAFVTHGGVIMAILSQNSEPERGFFNGRPENCGCVTCEWADGKLSIQGGV